MPPSDMFILLEGQRKWAFEQYHVSDSGILTTASDLLFTGGREGS